MISKKYSNLLLKTAAVSALCTGMAFTVAAQEDAGEEVVSVDTATTEADDESRQDVVRVTGSRLNNTFTSIAPLDVITADEAALEGISDVATLLQTATVAAGSPQVTAATSAAFVQNGGIGTNTISLRGLGASRTLTLINGRRAGKAGTRGGVSAFDLNAIPLSAVGSIEILKDGASSIYGSDAVAGVVNIITKKGDTSEIDFFYSAPQEQGGEQLRASGTWGKAFDKGNIMFTADYRKQSELARNDRDFLDCQEDYVFNEDGSRADLINPATGAPGCQGSLWGHVWLYDYVDGFELAGPAGDGRDNFATRPFQTQNSLLQYDYDGSLAANLPAFGPSGAGLVAPAGWFAVGLGELLGDGAEFDPYYTPTAAASEALISAYNPQQGASSVFPETETVTLFADGDYQFDNGMEIYGEALLNRRETKVNGFRQFWTYRMIYAYDYGAGFEFAGGDQLAIDNGWGFTAANPISGGTSPLSVLGLSPTGVTDHSDDNVTVQYINGVVGTRGSFDGALSDWGYDAFFQFSQSDGEYEKDVIYDDAVTPYESDVLTWFFGDVPPTCANVIGANGAGTTTVRGVDCVDVNWYDPALLNGDLPQNERDFLFGTETGTTIYEQSQFEVYFDGPLFELPAGTVGAGFGFNRTRERINDVPPEVDQQGNAWGSSSAGITRGAKTSTAVFGELAIPLLKDMPLVESLDLSLSGRWTDVDVYGDGTTYKAGLGWQITPSLRARTTYGTSFRAPALFELYLDNQTASFGQRFDPCIRYEDAFADGDISERRRDNCAADGVPANIGGGGGDATITSSGNAGELEAETSTAFNAGVIWSPTWIDLRASVDYYEIEINDQISQLGGANILLGCYESDNFATEPLCDLFERNPGNGLITEITNNYINVATQTNKGFDFQADYSRDFSFGTLRVDGTATLQLEDEILLFANSEPLDTNGETGEPEWVGEVSFALERGPWSAFWGIDYIGETSNRDSFGGNAIVQLDGSAFVKVKTEEVIYHSLSLTRELPHDFTVRVGVANVFDEAPPRVSTVNIGEYNIIGQVPFESQYDWLGRRAFVNINKTF
ncbi:MAG: TonB-dependent receptor [Henriciella sp.]